MVEAMKPTERKRLLLDITEAQDTYTLTVTSLRGMQFTISRPATNPLGLTVTMIERRDAMRAKSLDEAAAALRAKGWTVTDISLPNGEKTFLVGA